MYVHQLMENYGTSLMVTCGKKIKKDMDDNNPVGVWLRDEYEFTCRRDDKIPVDEMYDNYKARAKSDITKIKFGRFMSLLGYKSDVVCGNRRYYRGFKLKGRALETDPLE